MAWLPDSVQEGLVGQELGSPSVQQAPRPGTCRGSWTGSDPHAPCGPAMLAMLHEFSREYGAVCVVMCHGVSM